MDFITIHVCGNERLINMKWILEVDQGPDGECYIYPASAKGYIKTDESYDKVKSMIFA